MPSELSDTQYAFRRKEILGLVNQLRAVGQVEFFSNSARCLYVLTLCHLCRAQGDLDLPRIAVIGNQSAGMVLLVLFKI